MEFLVHPWAGKVKREPFIPGLCHIFQKRRRWQTFGIALGGGKDVPRRTGEYGRLEGG